MEKNFPELYQPDPKYQILGQNAQLVQILIMPNETIFTKEPFIQYHSPNVKIAKEANTFFKFLYQQQSYASISNTSKLVAYIGIGRGIGKIMVIDTILTMNFWVKESAILASTFRLPSQKEKYQIINFIEKFSNQMIDFQKFRKISINQDNFSKKHLIFMQTNGSMIEKELGYKESIIVRKDSLIAYSDTLQFKQSEGYQNLKFLHITGPGKLYFEGILERNGIQNIQPVSSSRYFLISILFMLVCCTWGLAMEIMMEHIL